MQDTPKRAVFLYLGLTLAFSAAVWALVIWSGRINMGFGLMIPAIMWCPAVAALLASRLLNRKIQSLGWAWPEKKYLLISYFLPVAYTSLAYGTVGACHLAGWNSELVSDVAHDFGLPGLPVRASLVLYIVCMATGGVIENLSMALGEEIGWRGFLVPELAKQMSYVKLSLLSGVIWAAWHSPLLFFADYNVGTNRWYELLCSTVTCVSISFILAWLRLKSDSLWPAALLHASHNLFVAGIFDPFTRNTGRTFWFTTEFGAALAITSSVFALYFWMRRHEFIQPPSESRKQSRRMLGTGSFKPEFRTLGKFSDPAVASTPSEGRLRSSRTTSVRKIYEARQ